MRLFTCVVQHECIPHAILGMDVLCQAKSGMGKTAVFVLSILQQLDPKPNEVQAIVLCHTRELAFQVIAQPPHSSLDLCRLLDLPLSRLSGHLLQICHEFERFSARLRNIKVANFFGGIPVKDHKEQLKKETPNVIVGTPGRIKQVGSLNAFLLARLIIH